MNINEKKYYRRLVVAVLVTVGMVSVSTSYGLEIALKTAGTLKNHLPNPAEVTELSLSGPVDFSDLRFASKEMAKLSSLDLSGCEIVAYDDAPLDGRTTYPADEIPDLVFCGTELTRIVFPKIGEITIGAGAFAGTKLEEVNIPDNIIKVSDGAFAGCQELKSISVGHSEFGRGVFEDCTTLRTADVSRAETTGEAMFRGCTNLKTVDGAEKLSVISDRAFENCDSLKSLTIGSALQTIGSRAFADSGLEQLNLKNSTSLKELGEGVLAGCTRLREVTFSPGLEEVKFAAMLSDSALKSLDASALTTPPSTEEVVWGGVDQPNVTLSVAEGLGQTFKQADQWREFKIVEIAGADDPIADRTKDLEWFIEGNALTVKSYNGVIKSLKVFTDGGSEIISLTPDSDEVIVDLSATVQKIFIISVKTTDGTTTIIKTVRH